MRQFPYEFELKKPLMAYPSAEFHQQDILEIGPGRGDLLFELATTNSGQNYLAIELGKKRYQKLVHRIEETGLKNVTIILGDARLILPNHFQENSFEKIFVLFPDPWPKCRHQFRRLLTKEFLWLLAHQLKPKGELILATDVLSYANTIREELEKISLLENKLDESFVSRLPEIPKTFFEDKWQKMGRTNYFLKYEKKRCD